MRIYPLIYDITKGTMAKIYVPKEISQSFLGKIVTELH